MCVYSWDFDPKFEYNTPNGILVSSTRHMDDEELRRIDQEIAEMADDHYDYDDSDSIWARFDFATDHRTSISTI